ncbi:MAG: hypothetical protein RLZZ574_264 [Cyanobacteriota bacterium]|jgi:hypothetical protein
MSGFGHGNVGTREQDFTALLPLRAVGYPADLLLALAGLMKGERDKVKDGADAEENLLLPAGYTYFGQFIDHDLTFDNTSSLNPADIGAKDRLPSNLRTPRLIWIHYMAMVQMPNHLSMAMMEHHCYLSKAIRIKFLQIQIIKK